MLISATPFNNSPKDIYNLLLLFQDGKETTLDVANLQGFFAERMDEWKEARQLPTAEARKAVMIIPQKIREKILAPIPQATPEIIARLGCPRRTRNYGTAMNRLLSLRFIEMTIPGKPRSKSQKYRLTPKGQALLASTQLEGKT